MSLKGEKSKIKTSEGWESDDPISWYIDCLFTTSAHGDKGQIGSAAFYEGTPIVPLGCAPKSLYIESMVPSMVMSKKKHNQNR